MKRLLAAIAIAAFASIALGANIAAARTPTPTATPTVTFTPTPTPTISPDQIAIFRANTWLDAHLVAVPIVAKIGDTECGQSVPVAVACDPISCGPVQDIPVVSNQIKPGCGFDGAPITFFVVGIQASPTVIWHSGRGPFLQIVAGLPFASVRATFSWPQQLPGSNRNNSDAASILIPYIGGTACGYDDILMGVWGSDGWLKNRYESSLIVYSAEQRAGCGYEGAPITFKLVDSQRNVLATAEEKGVWRAFDGTDQTAEKIDLTLVTPAGIRIASVGTGDSQQRDDLPIDAIVGLSLAGLATIATGILLRKKIAR